MKKSREKSSSDKKLWMLPLDNLYGRQPLKHNSKQICTYVLSNMRYKAPWNERGDEPQP